MFNLNTEVSHAQCIIHTPSYYWSGIPIPHNLVPMPGHAISWSHTSPTWVACLMRMCEIKLRSHMSMRKGRMCVSHAQCMRLDRPEYMTIQYMTILQEVPSRALTLCVVCRIRLALRYANHCIVLCIVELTTRIWTIWARLMRCILQVRTDSSEDLQSFLLYYSIRCVNQN